MASNTVASNAIVLEVLGQDNYDDWKSRVEIYLLAEDLWDVVNTEPPKREEGEDEYKAWATKNAKALHAITISCGTQLFSFIRETRSAKKAWDLLEERFKTPYILDLEKKEREERNRLLHIEANTTTEDFAPVLHHQSRFEEPNPTTIEDLTPVDDEELEIKSNERGIPNDSSYDFDSSYQPFFDSVVNGDWDSAQRHLVVLPNALRARNPSDNGCTALHVAAREGHVHIVKELVSLMTREYLEIRDDDGCTALHLAVANGHDDVVKELVPLMRQQSLGFQDNFGRTALHYAAYKGYVHMVKELVQFMREEDLEIKDSNSALALHLAVLNGHEEIVKELVPLMRQQSLGFQDNFGLTALHRAADKGYVHMVKELVQFMREEDLEIKESKYSALALHAAVLNGHEEIVKELVPLMRQQSLGFQDNFGLTALHRAADKGYVHMVKELVQFMREEDLEIKESKYSALALHLAVLNGHEEIVKVLVPLMRQQSLGFQDNFGRTALHYVAYKGYVHMVKELVQFMREEDLEIKDSNSALALHLAVLNGHEEIVKELVPLMRQQSLGFQDNFGLTALHRAADKGYVHMVKELVQFMREEDLEIKESKYSALALHAAVLNGHEEIVKELVPLMRQQSLGFQDNFGLTALHRAADKGYVHMVKELVQFMRKEDLEIKESKYSALALHAAVGNGHVHVVKELAIWMRKEGLEIKNGFGYTGLGLCLLLSSNRGDEYGEGEVIEMMKPMVAKNKKLLGIPGPPWNAIPVVHACRLLKFQVTRYLYTNTLREALIPPTNGGQGAALIVSCILANEFDIPWDLLSNCPSLATNKILTRATSPILALAQHHSAFLSGMRLNFRQQWIYDCISIQDPNIIGIRSMSITVSDSEDESITVSNSEDDGGTQRHFVISAVSFVKRLVKSILEVLGINRLYEMKVINDQMLKLISCMAEGTGKIEDLTYVQYNFIKKSIFTAIEKGNVEFVTRICKANRDLLHLTDEKQRNIFHFAVECRQEEIFCLIHGLDKEKRNHFGSVETNFNNSLLHAAAQLSPPSQSNHIQGESLQMQRALQWFKEVESVVPAPYHNYRNATDGLTAAELFHKNHQKLMIEAEKSMKGIASSCTVVGALIITMMFAAAFTVPGGNNGNTGIAMFIDENLFLVFIASDTTSLISSTTSVIIFLGILASRYSEKDFLKSLPTKMMIGLFTLFIAITTMMIAFSCGLIITLHEKYPWIVVPGILVSSIPVISFIWMLFPLLVQTFISTYGPGIFNKKVKPWC